MTKISGIKAAWMERDGLGELSVSSKTITFRSSIGDVVRWWCNTPAEAAQQIKIFRAATKYPKTREAA